MPDPVPAELVIELLSAPTLNFASEQSGVPVVSSVFIRNIGAEPITDATLEVELVPDLVAPQTFAVPTIRGGEDVSLGPLDLRLPPGHLRSVVETEQAELRWRLRIGETFVAPGYHAVEVLPFNHWPGLRAPPALLATFALPNHPVVAKVLVRVRERLRKDTGDAALSGYQSRSQARVTATAAAVYGALQDLGLTYIGVPASFEDSGQKVRLPDMVLDEQMGNCLDVTLLVAACLEQAGLAPLLVVVRGHALPAVWLVDDRFPECVVYDAARLRNLIALGEVLAFDSSTTVETNRPPFDRAVEVADSILSQDEAFLCAIDVRVARHDRFRPLPIRMVVPVGEPTLAAQDSPTAARALLVEAAAEPEAEESPAAVASPPEPVVARFKRWKDKLLDLSLRNKLLNYRTGSAGLLLQVPDLTLFEDALAADRPFEIHPRPPMDPRDERNEAIVEVREDAATARARLLADLAHHMLHSPLTPGELAVRAVELDRAARVDREEGGANTLYIALGFLRWFEAPSSEMPRFAPLLLLPVQLEFDRGSRRLRIRRSEEDAVGNVTLVEKMRTDFAVDLAFLSDLDTDDSGVDVPKVLRRAREAVRGMARWEVVEEAHVGLFSFTKFLMWKDLDDNADVLLESPVVRHIATGGVTAFPDPVGEPDPRRQDAEVPPADLPTVLDADSTQLGAVIAALRGRSFVLQGPPGTGKSQTIANVIAASLAAGKTVLFVSEKMAALEVVHRRLVGVGLGDFCLELHSSKANKRLVVESLGKAMDRTAEAGVPDWSQRSAELHDLRTQLNAYTQALHAARPLGLTFFQASARLLALRGAPEVRLPISEGGQLPEVRWTAMRDCAVQLALTGKRVEPVAANPWRGCRLDDWSQAADDAVRDALDEARAALEEVEAAGPVASAMWQGASPASLDDAASIAALAAAIGSGPVPDGALADDWPSSAQRIMAWVEAMRLDTSRRADLDQRWLPALYESDLNRLARDFKSWARAFFLLALLFLWGPRKALRGVARRGLPDNRRIAADLEVARTLHDGQEDRDRESAWVGAVLGTAWAGGDVEAIAPVPERVERLRGAQALWRTRGQELPAASVALCNPVVPQASRQAVQAAGERLDGALARLNTAMGTLSECAALGDTPAVADLAQLRQLLDNWNDSADLLRQWCLYRGACARALEAGIGPVVDAHVGGRLAAAQLVAATERGVLSRWVGAVRDAEPALCKFDGDAHHARVHRFREADRAHLDRSKRHVTAILDARRPATAGAAQGSEPAVLAREVRKRTRHLPVRRLFQAIPGLLPRLKPCLMMSPLSIAQYLPATGRRFDLVVFDEASQICTHDAIGAIARGDQVVIVGDSRQLPPTTFFSRGSSDEDTAFDDNDVMELESILDEAVAARLPQQMLGWHYRSQHEALIDFSNRHYYDAKLNVFPAARGRAPDLGVQWCHVHDGVYEKGRSRTNPREAERLVAWLNNELVNTRPGATSYGIVTFSLPQQTLIQDLLDKARATDPRVEAHFSDTLQEPVFVKNLENVQGDERDVILFSICYGPDESRRVWMNFGPLNRAGGERRLNVAITRARRLLRVYSTLTADQVDLARTKAIGARHLRAFLQYAAEQGGTIDRPARTADFDSEFERQVHDVLVGLGYRVDCQVGCGGYRIDLAVVHPERPGEVVLGIECDGANYHSGATARDRDRLRQQVLERLGWRLHRVWSTDWWFQRDREEERLKQAVEDAIADVDLEPLDLDEESDTEPPGAAAPLASAAPVAATQPPAAATPPAPESPAVPYVYAVFDVVSANPEDFFLPTTHAALRERIVQVIDVEAPLHTDEVCRRVMACWLLSKLTNRVRRQVAPALSGFAAAGRMQVAGDTVWPSGVAPETWTTIRGPAADGTTRDAAMIPVEEIAAAVEWVLSRSFSVPAAALARETARLFGITRLGRLVEERTQAGIDLACARGRGRREEDRVVWVG